MKRCIALFLPMVALAACQDAREPFAPSAPEEGTFAKAASDGAVIPGRFIVTVREGVSAAAVAGEHGVQPDYVYAAALNGFAGAMSDAARNGLLADSRVLRVTPDGVATIVTTQNMDSNGDPWGLDRIDARSALDKTYTYTNTGSGVVAYVIDTGIKIDHPDFGTRASHGYDFIDNDADATDCHGHGTHVAGTVGGTTWGVAKGVSLVGVRVLDCGGSGTWSGVIAGIDWVTQQKLDSPSTPMVSNMSLGGGYIQEVNDATTRMIDAGVASAVAAGNDSKDACMSSPASTPRAMTMGATTKSDSKAIYSNVGDCIDWFAPGSGIKSAWIDDSYSGDGSMTRSISGTSMASPHTAGVAALYLESFPSATADAVRNALYDLTTKNVVSRSRTANNHLLFTNF